mmetsp:Transcript_9205/g.27239  ORF Transcript_9205/g.27239 Transcript_9205/m.27239 type:complete len:356 (-) Transcript_9205:522-1589(-)
MSSSSREISSCCCWQRFRSFCSSSGSTPAPSVADGGRATGVVSSGIFWTTCSTEPAGCRLPRPPSTSRAQSSKGGSAFLWLCTVVSVSGPAPSAPMRASTSRWPLEPCLRAAAPAAQSTLRRSSCDFFRQRSTIAAAIFASWSSLVPGSGDCWRGRSSSGFGGTSLDRCLSSWRAACSSRSSSAMRSRSSLVAWETCLATWSGVSPMFPWPLGVGGDDWPPGWGLPSEVGESRPVGDSTSPRLTLGRPRPLALAISLAVGLDTGCVAAGGSRTAGRASRRDLSRSRSVVTRLSCSLRCSTRLASPSASSALMLSPMGRSPKGSLPFLNLEGSSVRMRRTFSLTMSIISSFWSSSK